MCRQNIQFGNAISAASRFTSSPQFEFFDSATHLREKHDESSRK